VKRRPNPKAVKRERVAERIAARQEAAAIAGTLQMKIERYLVMDILSTQKDDHTKSLSERMTVLEQEYGELRQQRMQLEWWRQQEEGRRAARPLARLKRMWWHVKGGFSRAWFWK
jgi:hypothetical protein